MASFPSYAKVLMVGYSETADYGVLRTDMDAGLAKQRARWSKPVVTREVRIKVRTKVDKVAFDAWMRSDLSGGVGWFDYRDCLDGVVKQARIVGGKLAWSTTGRIWIAQGQLETIG